MRFHTIAHRRKIYIANLQTPIRLPKISGQINAVISYTHLIYGRAKSFLPNDSSTRDAPKGSDRDGREGGVTEGRVEKPVCR